MRDVPLRVPGERDERGGLERSRAAQPAATRAALARVSSPRHSTRRCPPQLSIVNGPLEAIAAELGFAGDAARAGLVVSSVLVGAATGSVAGGRLADRLGRPRALAAVALPLALGAVLCSVAPSIAVLVLGRLVVGVGVGAASVVTPLYLAEIAPTRLRGALASLSQLSVVAGVLGALVVNLRLGPAAWRRSFLLGAAPALALLVGSAAGLAPETPAWLAGRGDAPGAARAAAALGLPVPTAALPVADLEGGKAAPRGSSWLGLSLLFPASPLRRPARLAVTLFALQQFSGINAVIYYSSPILAASGVADAALASVAVGSANLAGSLAATALLDRAGRVPLLAGSYSGMAAAAATLSASMLLPSLRGTLLGGRLALWSIIAYILAFSVGAGPVPGILSSEVFPSEERARGVSLAMLSHWTFNFCVGLGFPVVVAALGGSPGPVFAFFAAGAAGGAVHALIQCPETRGRSLDDVQRDLAAARSSSTTSRR